MLSLQSEPAGQPLLSGGSGAPTWGTLSVSFGGTGLTSVASGALLYGSGGTTLNTLAIGSAGYILASNGTAPYWASLSSLFYCNRYRRSKLHCKMDWN
jgi:hypothetical protein